MLPTTQQVRNYNSPDIHQFLIVNFPQNKMNLFILSGHAGDSFAAFFNGVILQKNNAAVITTAVITAQITSKICDMNFNRCPVVAEG